MLTNTFLFKLSLFFFIIQSTQSITIETIELPLTADQGKLTTIFQIADIQEQMEIDINSNKITVCCKTQNSIFQKIYYFLFNPFFQIRDYSCKTPNQKGLVNDSAKISKLGFIQILFEQQIFPSCSKGNLGLNTNSYFSQFLPVNLKSYTIFQNPAEYKKYTLKFGQDLDAIKEYSYFSTLTGYEWAILPTNIKFNQVILGNMPLVFNSNSKQIRFPRKMFQFINHQLTTSFQCKNFGKQLICPCQTGQPSSYPQFQIIMSNSVVLSIKPDNFMIQDSEICRVQIQESANQYVEANILFFQDYIFKFDPINKKIGILKNLNDQSNHEKLKLPLQLILNCVVILLLCIFLALVLIEIIKRASGLAQVRDQVFRVDVRNKNQFHYASD